MEARALLVLFPMRREKNSDGVEFVSIKAPSRMTVGQRFFKEIKPYQEHFQESDSE